MGLRFCVRSTAVSGRRGLVVRRTDVAWKNLSRQKGRLAVSVSGVAFAVLLILLLQGLYNGITAQATEYIRSVDADIWVAEAGTPGDFFHSVSLLPVSLREPLLGVDGVAEVTPLLGRPVVFNLNGSDVDFFLLGVDPASGVGGPPGVEKGKRRPEAGEIVVDRVFARNNGLELDDDLDVLGRRFRIVGIAKGGNSVLGQFAWATLPDVGEIFDSGDIVSYFMVRGTTSSDPKAIALGVRNDVPGANPITSEEFVRKNTADLREGFLPIVGVLALVGFIVGTVVIGLTIYAATLEKRSEFGLLKALGLSNWRLLRIIWRQSLIAGAIGLLTGIPLTLIIGFGLEAALPSFVTAFRLIDVIVVSVLVLGMSVVASFMPARPVIRLDPAQVFRV